MFFEINESYTGTMWTPGKDGGSCEDYFGMKVLAVEMPLVTFLQAGSRLVINTSSPAFVSATAEEKT